MARRSGFSLVELLIVLLVVSILAALLLPTMERGIESSRDVVCKSNLRQFGVSEGMYSEDYRGPASVAQFNLNANGKRSYYMLMAWSGYTDSPYAQASNPGPTFSQGWDLPARGMWACPSVSTYIGTYPGISTLVADTEAAPLWEAEYPSYNTYGPARYVAAFLSHYMPFLTTRFDADPRYWNTWDYGTQFGAHSLYRYMKTAEMRQHSRVMLMTDATSWESPYMAFNSRNPANFIYARHDGHFNAAMWDGRVTGVQYRDFKAFSQNNPRMQADGYPVLKAPHALVLRSRALQYITPPEYPMTGYNPTLHDE